MGDTGDDDHKLRQLAREHDVRPLIEHRASTLLHEVWNARLDGDLYHRGNTNENESP